RGSVLSYGVVIAVTVPRPGRRGRAIADVLSLGRAPGMAGHHLVDVPGTVVNVIERRRGSHRTISPAGVAAYFAVSSEKPASTRRSISGSGGADRRSVSSGTGTGTGGSSVSTWPSGPEWWIWNDTSGSSSAVTCPSRASCRQCGQVTGSLLTASPAP